MKINPFPRNLFIIFLMLGVYTSYIRVQPAQAFPDTVIDNFNDTTTLTQSGVGTNTATFDDASILGGERDLVVNVTAGGGNLTVDTNTSFPDQFSSSAGSGIFATTQTTYDGNDGDASALDPIGLGGIDMTTNDNNAFILLVERDDLLGALTITAYTDATHCSSLTQLLPGGIGSTALSRAFLFNFNNFTTLCTNPVDFQDIGALQILADGTVEDGLDLVIRVFAAVSVDFGDLDDPGGNYNTQLDDQFDGNIYGAGHVISSLFLGSSIDAEVDGQPNGNGNALGDDETGDDEDGVIRPATSWTTGSATGGHVQVTVNGDGCLYGWIDWNRNGTLTNVATTTGSTLNDRVIAQSVTAGTITIDFPVPSALNFSAGSLNARFRLYPRDPGDSCWTGTGSFAKFPDRFQHYGGEVEDYTWSFGPTAVALQSAHTATNSPAAAFGFVAVLLVAVVSTGVTLYRRQRQVR